MTDYKQLFFLDESARNDRTVQPKRGRSVRGTRCKATVQLGRGSYKLNLLALVNHTGVLDSEIQETTFDDVDFVEFLDKKASKFVSPYPGPNSVLVLDNWWTHESVAVVQWCARHQIIPVFEPAHDPNVNLTERVFNAIKMKEKVKGVYGNVDAARASLAESVFECVGLNFKSVMKRIGYVDGITDSDP